VLGRVVHEVDIVIMAVEISFPREAYHSPLRDEHGNVVFGEDGSEAKKAKEHSIGSHPHVVVGWNSPARVAVDRRREGSAAECSTDESPFVGDSNIETIRLTTRLEVSLDCLGGG
jgi:hypothetical protein